MCLARDMRLDAARRFALSLPEAWADTPWGDSVVKVGSKIFVFLGDNAEDSSITVKVPESHEHAMSFEGAAPTGPAVGRAGSAVAELVDPQAVGRRTGADRTTLVGNLKLDAGSKVGSVTSVQVHILLAHPTACLKVFNFVTDQDMQIGVLDTMIITKWEPPTLVEFRLEPTATGTRLHICESGFAALPDDAVGAAFIEVPGPSDEWDLEAPPGVDVRWLYRGMGERVPSPLPGAVQSMQWKPGRVQAFVHGEKAAVKSLRLELRLPAGRQRTRPVRVRSCSRCSRSWQSSSRPAQVRPRRART